MKCIGEKKEGGNYGHLGAADTKIIVYKVLEIDTANTLRKFSYINISSQSDTKQ